MEGGVNIIHRLRYIIWLEKVADKGFEVPWRAEVRRKFVGGLSEWTNARTAKLGRARRSGISLLHCFPLAIVRRITCGIADFVDVGPQNVCRV
jgi:hypothetical protein